MSVQTTFYVMWGVKLQYNAEDYDGEDAPYILFDDMSGEYMIPGIVLFFGSDYDPVMVETDISSLPDKEREYKEQWNQYFPMTPLPPFKLISLVHYS